RVLGHGHGHRMIADFGLDAEHGTGHVALHAGIAGTRFGVMAVGGGSLADGGVALRAKRVRVGAKLWVALDLGLVRGSMAGGADGLAAQEALALPESKGVVGEAARASVGPVGGVLVDRLAGFEDRQEVVVVIGACRVPGHVDIAE